MRAVSEGQLLPGGRADRLPDGRDHRLHWQHQRLCVLLPSWLGAAAAAVPALSCQQQLVLAGSSVSLPCLLYYDQCGSLHLQCGFLRSEYHVSPVPGWQLLSVERFRGAVPCWELLPRRQLGGRSLCCGHVLSDAGLGYLRRVP